MQNLRNSGIATYDSVNVHSTNLFKTHLDRFYYDYQYDIV